MQPNLPFLSAASNALLKPDGLVRWKVRVVKDVRFSLALTEVMKIARLKSLLLDAPRQPLPRPRLRLVRRLALLSQLGLTLNLFTKPEATSLSSAEPHALWSLTRPFALLSLPLNFMRLSPTFPRPLPLAQTKLPIPC